MIDDYISPVIKESNNLNTTYCIKYPNKMNVEGRDRSPVIRVRF